MCIRTFCGAQLLPRTRQHVSDRVRQHTEQRQSHSLRVAWLQRRLGRRPVGGALPEFSAPSTRKCPLGLVEQARTRRSRKS